MKRVPARDGDHAEGVVGRASGVFAGSVRMRLRGLFSRFSRDLGIDLGTANTLVYSQGQGIVLCEPSVVAMDRDTREVKAVGSDAKRMLGRTPGNVTATRPLKDGVIADFEVTEAMLAHFIRKVQERRILAYPRVLIGIPSGVTEVEQRAVLEAAVHAGARQAWVIEEPMAAAIGAGLPVEDATGSMIVDIGGGTTDIAVISLSGIVYSRTVKVAGDEMDEAIIQYIKRKHNLLIGERTSEQIKIEIGSAFPLEKELTMEIKGRNLIDGIPKNLVITDSEIREALSDCNTTIINALRVALERTPPELSADIVDRGIVLTGGGALLKSLDKRIMDETKLPVFIAENPLFGVALGVGKMLSNFDLLRKVAI